MKILTIVDPTTEQERYFEIDLQLDKNYKSLLFENVVQENHKTEIQSLLNIDLEEDNHKDEIDLYFTIDISQVGEPVTTIDRLSIFDSTRKDDSNFDITEFLNDLRSHLKLTVKERI